MNSGLPIAEIISSRKWESALFTTFTLSLTYFETSILPILQQQGCSNIWIVVDAYGYRNSLIERKSWRVGQEYRVIPVALPKGVFHAKCTYLAGSEGDLLCVGSGNLTFGGHGQNLEVIEVLKPEEASASFEGFSDFLLALKSREDLIIPDSTWINCFSDRAMEAAVNDNSDPDGHPVLLHTVTVPIVGQIQDASTAIAPVREAILMSPFYDPAGTAVLKLVEATGTSVLNIATLGGSTSFPLSKSKRWSFKVNSVRPSFRDSRPLHAKWIELVGERGRLLLTGSINATGKALCSTENIEVGVLRSLKPDEEVVEWKRRSAPEEKLLNPKPSGLGTLELVHARFRREDNALAGQVMTLQAAKGDWECSIVAGDGRHESFAVSVGEDGCFVISDPELEKYSLLPAVQIVMRTDTREARGWVHMERILNVGKLGCLGAGALTRLISRMATDDDMVALLDYLSMSAAKHMPVFNARIHVDVSGKMNESGTPKSAEIVSVSLDELDSLESMGSSSSFAPDLSASRERDLHNFFERLRCTLLGDKQPKAVGGQAGSSTDVDNDSASEDFEADAPFISELKQFERKLWSVIQTPVEVAGDDEEKEESRSERRRAMLCMLLEVGMSMRLWRSQDLGMSMDFLQDWVMKTVGYVGPARKITPLEQHVVTTVVIIGHIKKCRTNQVAATEQHELLESFYRGTVEKARVEEALIDDPHIGFAARLLSNANIDMKEELEAILNVPTRRMQLMVALNVAKSGSAPEKLPVFQDEIGEELYQALMKENFQSKIKSVTDSRPMCAHDYYAMTGIEAWSFKHNRIAKCIHCKRYTVNLSL